MAESVSALPLLTERWAKRSPPVVSVAELEPNTVPAAPAAAAPGTQFPAEMVAASAETSAPSSVALRSPGVLKTRPPVSIVSPPVGAITDGGETPATAPLAVNVSESALTVPPLMSQVSG